MKTLLVVGNDKVSGRALESLTDVHDGLCIAVDRSTRINRVVKLISRRRISFSLVVRMTLCEYHRNGFPPSNQLNKISSNNDLVQLIHSWQPERVLLFRAGLIINREVIDTGLPILNIHCANVQGYGGLGSISRALADKAFDQFACLHVVTETIDGGIVLDQEPYFLSPTITYCANEDIAYDAGIRLLKRTIKNNI